MNMSCMTHSDNTIRLLTLQVMSHTSVSHVTHINTSRITRKRQYYSPRDATSHVAHISGSCHTHKWVVYDTRQHRWMASSCHESRCIHQWVMLHTWMPYVWHTTHQWVILHTWMTYVWHTIHQWVMSHTWMTYVRHTANNIGCLFTTRVTSHDAHSSGSCHIHEWVVYDTQQQHPLPRHATSEEWYIRCHNSLPRGMITHNSLPRTRTHTSMSHVTHTCHT